MNEKAKILFATWWLAAALSFSTATAAENPFAATYRGETDLSYLTGGVGRDQRDSLVALAKDENLKLVFALKATPPAHNEFVSTVSVRIFDGAGREVLAASDTGPWLFTKLPSGSYRVEATLLGRTLTQTAKVVEGRRTQLAFLW